MPLIPHCISTQPVEGHVGERSVSTVCVGVRAVCWVEPVSVLFVGLGVGYRPFGCCVHLLQVCDAICYELFCSVV
jgi:hypothetical protein